MKLLTKHIALYFLSLSCTIATLQGFGGGGPGQGSAPAENDGFLASKDWPETNKTGMTYYNKMRDVGPTGKPMATTIIQGPLHKKPVAPVPTKDQLLYDALKEKIMRDIQATKTDAEEVTTKTENKVKEIIIEIED